MVRNLVLPRPPYFPGKQNSSFYAGFPVSDF